MKCEFCNGTGETLTPVLFKKINIRKMASVPCVCFTSRLVSQENPIIQYLGDDYLHPDNLDSQLVFLPDDLPNSPNLLITGDPDNFKIQMKSLLMKNRFIVPKPRILFSRSIGIVQKFHVQQDDDTSPHLSATLTFDLVIVIFGTKEQNKALSPCMAQMVMTRKEEKRPTWIYVPPPKVSVSQCDQEKSTELEETVKDFKEVVLLTREGSIKTGANKESKSTAADFNVGKK
jgi:hypothetical protein